MTLSTPATPPTLDSSKFASTKYTWEDLKQIITNQSFPILRHVSQEATYRLYSQMLKREWKSVYDFVLYCKFNFEKRLILLNEKDVNCDGDGKDDKKNYDKDFGVSPSDVSAIDVEMDAVDIHIPTLPRIPSPPHGFVWEAYEPPIKEKKKKRVLAMNDFPYYLEDGVEHWCLWKLGDTDTNNHDDVNDEDIEWAKETLKQRGDVVEMMHWINPVHLKSLPGIDHAHIVCLIKNTA